MWLLKCSSNAGYHPCILKHDVFYLAQQTEMLQEGLPNGVGKWLSVCVTGLVFILQVMLEK